MVITTSVKLTTSGPQICGGGGQGIDAREHRARITVGVGLCSRAWGVA